MFEYYQEAVPYGLMEQGNGCSVFNMPTVVQMFWHTLPCVNSFWALFFFFLKTFSRDREAVFNMIKLAGLFIGLWTQWLIESKQIIQFKRFKEFIGMIMVKIIIIKISCHGQTCCMSTTRECFPPRLFFTFVSLQTAAFAVPKL